MKGEGATDWAGNWKLIDIPRSVTHTTQRKHTHMGSTEHHHTSSGSAFLVSIRLAYNAGPGYSTQHSHTLV